jgi:hypothetical protein
MGRFTLQVSSMNCYVYSNEVVWSAIMYVTKYK